MALYEAGGTVTFEDYRQAVDDTKACLVDAGFEIYSEHQLENGGRPTLTYEAKAPTALVEQRGEGAFDAIYTECWENYSAVVETLYSASATPIESMEREIEKVKAQYAPLIEECLRELGIAKPAGADDDWWGAAAIEANQTLPGNPDCMQSTGYFAATDAIADVND